MTKYIQTFLLLLISIIWVGCDKDELTEKIETIKMYVSAETGTYQPWGSDIPVECMLVKEEGELEYSHLAFGGISGFEYVRGHEYELEVCKTTLANSPADGSGIAYALLKIIRDTPPAIPEPEELPEEAEDAALSLCSLSSSSSGKSSEERTIRPFSSAVSERFVISSWNAFLAITFSASA